MGDILFSLEKTRVVLRDGGCAMAPLLYQGLIERGAEMISADELGAKSELDVLVVCMADQCLSQTWPTALGEELDFIVASTDYFIPALRRAGRAGSPARVILIALTGERGTLHDVMRRVVADELGRQFAKTLGPDHITLNFISGSFFTWAGGVPGNALQRSGSPEDLIGAVTLLASRAGAFISGATLSLDGGCRI